MFYQFIIECFLLYLNFIIYENETISLFDYNLLLFGFKLFLSLKSGLANIWNTLLKTNLYKQLKWWCRNPS